MTGTAATAAAARAARTRTKHDRWIRELAGAGWTVIQAGAVVLNAMVVKDRNGNRTSVSADLYCTRCRVYLTDWCDDDAEVAVPLPKVLHAVTGHTCTHPRSDREAADVDRRG